MATAAVHSQGLTMQDIGRIWDKKPPAHTWDILDQLGIHPNKHNWGQLSEEARQKIYNLLRRGMARCE